MSFLSAQTIRRSGIVTPFEERTVHPCGASYGLSSCGYDVRTAQELLLGPGMCKLASTCERFRLPNDIVGFVQDKSTWARRFVTVQNTVLEPGWEGFLTLEVINHHFRGSVFIPSGAPIAQVMFAYLDEPTDQPYRGKYQNQPPIPVDAIFEDPTR